VRAAALVVWSVLAPVAVWADEGAGGALPFARYGAGARAMGMAGAFVAAADDGTAPVWNPAGLAQVSGLSFGSQYGSLSMDRQFHHVGMAYGVPEVGAVALSYVYFSAGTLEARAGNTLDPDSYFSDRESVLLVSFGTKASETLSWGANVKVYTHKLAGDVGTFVGGGVGFDVGVLVRHSEDWTSGAVLLDPYSSVAWKGGAADLIPATLRAGSAKRLWSTDNQRISAEADLEVNTWLQDPRWRIGAEYAWRDALFARAGLLYFTPTMGFGVRQKFSFFTGRLDYAAAPDRVDGWQHRFSLSIEL